MLGNVKGLILRWMCLLAALEYGLCYSIGAIQQLLHFLRRWFSFLVVITEIADVSKPLDLPPCRNVEI